jgi:hypothetical protein
VERIGRDGQPVPYRFRYDPQDISRIALFREGHWLGDGQAKELRQANGTVQPLSLVERQLAQRLARDTGRTALDWLGFVQEVDTLTTLRQREKRQVQRASHQIVPVPQPLSGDSPHTDYTDLLAQFIRPSGGTL